MLCDDLEGLDKGVWGAGGQLKKEGGICMFRADSCGMAETYSAL